MEPIEIRIVRLEPMRVASVIAFGRSPEGQAWELLRAWAEPRDLLTPADPAGSRGRIFGFNNPSPSAGSPNYGYEMWISVGPEVTAEAPVTIKDVPGAGYAVARCVGVEAIFPAWQQLAAWAETRPCNPLLEAQCLEEHVKFLGLPPDQFVMDLYLPIE
jgi:hypothetical protein